MKTAQEIYDSLVNYMNSNGGNYSAWYAGIATDPENRLFSDHNVIKNPGTWAYEPAATDDVARDVEKALLELGCDGGDGGGSDTTRCVYVYFKTQTTKP